MSPQVASTDLPAVATDVCLSRCSGLDATVALGLFMTQLRHRPPNFAVMHNAAFPTSGVVGCNSRAEGSTHETARVHHPSRRRSDRVAALGARAAAGSDAAHWRAHEPVRGRSARAAPRRGVPAGPATIGLE